MSYKQQHRHKEIGTQVRVYFQSVNATLLARQMQFAVFHNEQNSLLGVIVDCTLQEKNLTLLYIL
jgi:hypothetical protein